MADMFSRLEKINDNGRMVLQMEVKELAKISGVQPSSDGQERNWARLFEEYLSISQNRAERTVLEAAGRLVLDFPIQWWSSKMVYVYQDLSSRGRKEFNQKLLRIYLDALTSLPKI